MANTAQSMIDKLRILLGETDPLNSRWDDLVHLLYYINYGRREFAKDSLIIKNRFTQDTPIGITAGFKYAHFTLDPTVFFVDEVYWDDTEVEVAETSEWEEQLHGTSPSTQGRPYIYRLIGNAIDLYFAPDQVLLLEIFASIITTDLATLGEAELELNDDQDQAAIFKAASQALTDDDRDGSLYEASYQRLVKQWIKARRKRGPRYVEQTFTRKHRNRF